jgi:hypothetical protein
MTAQGFQVSLVRCTEAVTLRAPKMRSDETSGVFRESHAFSEIAIKRPISAPRRTETHTIFGMRFWVPDSHTVFGNRASGSREPAKRPLAHCGNRTFFDMPFWVPDCPAFCWNRSPDMENGIIASGYHGDIDWV